MGLSRRAPCCGFEWTVQEYEPRGPIFWNPYNNVVQCHNCGQSFVPVAEGASPRVETTPAGATVDTNNPAPAHPPEVVRLIEAARRVLDYDWGDTEIPDSWPEDQALRAALTPFRSETGGGR